MPRNSPHLKELLGEQLMNSCKEGFCTLNIGVHFSDSSRLQLPSYRSSLQLTDVLQINLMQARDFFCVNWYLERDKFQGFG